MRLLNTKSFEFQEFFDADIPEYAILSHRWSKEEISYQDFLQQRNLHYTGYAKIEEFCRTARSAKLEWGWVDTCCIDKSSSAELSEAINSMFRWYEEARMCFVYLSDVHVARGQGAQFNQAFVASQWFTRGWTLQELIAPFHLFFYNSNWHCIGDKITLGLTLSERTGIETGYLSRALPLNKACIAERMSWAAHRKTSRHEDIAYCLLGIFDIQMPLLYGEGKKAFTRLQEEIIRKSDDESIFAYSTVPTWIERPLRLGSHLKLGSQHGRWGPRWLAGPLPAEPDMYSPNLVHRSKFSWSSEPENLREAQRAVYHVTNKGIQMDLEYYELEDGTWLVPLLCNDNKTRRPYYMLLMQSPASNAPTAKVRIEVPQSWIHEQLRQLIADGHVKDDMAFKSASVYLVNPEKRDSYHWLDRAR